jgi:hypothetical protein
MNKILTGSVDCTFLDLTIGKDYKHNGGVFQDDIGDNRLVSNYTWEVYNSNWEEPELADVITKVNKPDLSIGDSHEALSSHIEYHETESAMRFNEGKAELSYLLSMPVATAGISAAFAMGAEKYARDNWKKGLDRNQLIDSAMRHLMKAQNGETFDEESGLDHLFHFAWNAMVLAEQEGQNK